MSEWNEKPLTEAPDMEAFVNGEYWMLSAGHHVQAFDFWLSAETAQTIMAALDAPEPPEWIEFSDVTHDHNRVRVSSIVVLHRSTLESRAAQWALNRALKARDEAFKKAEGWSPD